MASNLNPVPFLVNYTDPTKQGNLIGFNSTGNQPTGLYFREDGQPVTLAVVGPNQTGARLWDYVDISTALVEMAIDDADLTPTAGQWKISDGINNSSLLNFNTTASALQTAIDALPLVSPATVTVTLIQAGTYLMTGNANGAIVPLTGITQSLYPQCNISVIQLQIGDANKPSIQLIQLSLNPATYQTLTTPFPVADYTQQTLQAGGSGAFNIQVLTITPNAYDGTFTITTPQGTTAALPFNATALAVQTALLALNSMYQNYTVAGNTSGPFTITDTSGNTVADYTMNVTGLLVPIGFSGLLQLATPGVLERFLATTDEIITLKLQVRITYPGQNPITILNVPVNLDRNIIRSGATYTPAYPTAYSRAEANAFFIQNQSGVSGFTGGGSTNIDGIATIGNAAGVKISAYIGGIFYIWNLTSGTATGSAPDQITPTDYATSGFYWQLIAAFNTSESQTPWKIIAINYTAQADDKLQADTSGGSFTITLPASATVGDIIEIQDATLSWGTNNLTIARNGLKINGTTADYVANVSGGKLSCVYISAGYGWSIK